MGTRTLEGPKVRAVARLHAGWGCLVALLLMGLCCGGGLDRLALPMRYSAGWLDNDRRHCPRESDAAARAAESEMSALGAMVRDAASLAATGESSRALDKVAQAFDTVARHGWVSPRDASRGGRLALAVGRKETRNPSNSAAVLQAHALRVDESLQGRAQLSWVVRHDAAVALAQLRHYEQDEAAGLQAIHVLEGAGADCPNFLAEWADRDACQHVDRIAQWVDDRYARFGEVADEPFGGRLYRQLVDRTRSDARRRRQRFYNWETGDGPGTDLQEIWWTMLGRLEAEKALAALEAYHREQGVYPASLAELEAERCGSAPLDPWTGEPLLYGRVGSEFILYSAGPDGVDGHGRSDDQVFSRPSG